MISISNLSVSFGGTTLFDGVNFHINETDKIGLVGKNGAGKTTMLRVITGLTAPSSGQVQLPLGLVIGYLPQEMDYSKEATVMEEAMTVFSNIGELENEVGLINKKISTRADYESDEYNKLLIKLNELSDRLSVLKADNPEAFAEMVLQGLGFRRYEFGRKRATLSQGWNMRIELAKVLLKRPDILLLDEPTNHLDIESIGWLENYLCDYKGAMLLISHDRRFLDSVTGRTVEIVLGKIHDYKVPYSKYVELRAERLAQQKAAYDNQQRMIEKTENFIERFRYKPTKSNQVQSRVKQLERLERIEMDETDNARLHVKFPPAPRSGQVVVKTDCLKMAFGHKVVFSEANIVIERGEKVALLGRNGEGKTTMMRLITGELTPSSGSITLGYNVSLGYYAQNQEDFLDLKETVFGTLDRVAVGDIRTKLRDILGAFLFKGEDVDKRVAVLSGGERARLAMAKLILNPYNLLALDEPTNHMDIRSKDVLKQALQRYTGTMIVVSHDRDFLDGLVNKIYEFRDGHIREHLGGVDDFLRRRKIGELGELEIKSCGQGRKKGVSASYKEQKEVERESKRRKNRIESCEKAIGKIEAELAELEHNLSGEMELCKIDELLTRYELLKKELNAKMGEWESLHDS